MEFGAPSWIGIRLNLLSTVSVFPHARSHIRVGGIQANTEQRACGVMPPKFCLCNGSGCCRLCSYARNCRSCVNCAPGRHDRCLNLPGLTSHPSPSSLLSNLPTSSAQLEFTTLLNSSSPPARPAIRARKVLAPSNNSIKVAGASGIGKVASANADIDTSGAESSKHVTTRTDETSK